MQREYSKLVQDLTKMVDAMGPGGFHAEQSITFSDTGAKIVANATIGKNRRQMGLNCEDYRKILNTRIKKSDKWNKKELTALFVSIITAYSKWQVDHTREEKETNHRVQPETKDSQPTKDLSTHIQGCDLESCVRSVQGLRGVGGSGADNWILQFHSDTQYKGTTVQLGFLKIWNSESNDISHAPNNYDKKKTTLLENERKIYTHIIQQLVDLNICPNFVRFLGGGSCSYANLKAIALKNYSAEVVGAALAEGSLFEAAKTPPADQKAANINIATTKTFEMFMTEGMDTKNTKLGKHIVSILRSLRPLSDEELRIAKLALAFQAAAACYAMDLSKVYHNDLHDENIFITTFPSAKVFKYEYNGKECMFKTRVFLRVFDFDQAHALILDSKQKIDSNFGEFMANNGLSLLVYDHDDDDVAVGNTNFFEASSEQALHILGKEIHQKELTKELVDIYARCDESMFTGNGIMSKNIRPR